MPGGDGTGPLGLGPMTGRAAGYCAGFPVPGYMNPWAGRGWWGRGMAWGRPWGFGLGRGLAWRRGRGRAFWGPGWWAAAPPVAPYYPPVWRPWW